LYGQCGARTSAFYNKYVAASCTAVGRKLLMCAKNVIENVYDHLDCDTSEGKVNATAEYVYGDTDSVFFKFKLIKDGVQLKGKEALGLTIELAQEAGQLVTSFLKNPHELEYEKTFWPFILLSKKRYVGMLYETNPEECERKSMGIVLKRRDNAPIVKDVYGGLIDILMKNGNIDTAVDFVKSCFKKLKAGEIPLDKLIITKSLRSGYKNPKQIAHKVLADRMGIRDPGNKPKPGDRIRYAFVKKTKLKGMLQGDMIEDPDYIKKNKLPIDYDHYISNQLMKPIQQVFELVLDNLKDFQVRRPLYEAELIKIKDLPQEKFEKKRETLRHREIQKLLE
jgi:DNA polymerase elongation subunit (family B)